MAGTIRQAWERRKARAFPPGAVTFHLRAWAGGLSEDDRQAARALAARLDLDGLLVVHGTALAMADRVTLLAGPPGIGKSTVCRQLARHGRARLIEDGVALVGLAGGEWRLVTTGTAAVLATVSRLGKLLRWSALIFSTPYTRPDARASALRRALYRRYVDNLPFKIAVLRHRDSRPFTPQLLQVEALVLAEHPKDAYRAVLLPRAGAASEVADLAALAPAGVTVRRTPAVGRRREVMHRLAESLTAPPPRTAPPPEPYTGA